MNKSKWHEANKDTVREYMREYSRKYREANRERIKENQRKWQENNRERVRNYGRVRYLEKRELHLKYKYGIGFAEYDAMHAAQGGKCAICKAASTNGRGKKPSLFHVDHCHATGKVRGLLCNMCNRMIGLGKDDPTVLRAGADYVERHAQLVLTSPGDVS